MEYKFLNRSVLPIVFSLLVACGSEGENTNGDNKTPYTNKEEDETLTINSSDAIYTAFMNSNGDWEELESKELLFTKGAIDLVYVCHVIGEKYNVFYEKKPYESGATYKLCKNESIESLVQATHVRTEVVASNIKFKTGHSVFWEDDNISDTNVTAVGYNSDTEQAYAFKKKVDLQDYADFDSILTIDFSDPENSETVEHREIHDSLGYDYLINYQSSTVKSTLSFNVYNESDETNKTLAIDVPQTWKTSNEKYSENWLIGNGLFDENIKTYTRISSEPVYSKPDLKVNSYIFYIDDLEIDINNQRASIAPPKYSYPSFSGALYKLQYLNGNTGFHFHSFLSDDQVIFELINFTELPNFPNELIEGPAYLSSDTEAEDFDLEAEFVNSFWLEEGALGRESLKIKAQTNESM